MGKYFTVVAWQYAYVTGGGGGGGGGGRGCVCVHVNIKEDGGGACQLTHGALKIAIASVPSCNGQGIFSTALGIQHGNMNTC